MENAASYVAIILLLIGLFPIVGGIGLGIWETFIGPRLIPEKEIDRLAEEIITSLPENPERAALINEDRAWRWCEGLGQGKWRRVRREIRRRQCDSSESG